MDIKFNIKDLPELTEFIKFVKTLSKDEQQQFYALIQGVMLGRKMAKETA
ncbi:MAG TPA: hypothetical protein GX497_03715 [Bacillus bacterium]|nr:hypothetical protein [Bacillus sp. (in: firmicutes)]